jgi:hypothetical protein
VRAFRFLGIDCKKSGLWRRVVIALTLLAFAQQSYLTQTHIHVPPALAGEARSGFNGHGNAPSRDDPAHCPLCQEILLAGAYVTPVAIAILPPVLAVFLPAISRRELPFIDAASHDWRGRAPPRT